MTTAITKEIRTALSEPDGTFLLTHDHPQTTTAQGTITRLRGKGYRIERKATPEGSLYTAVKVPGRRRSPKKEAKVVQEAKALAVIAATELAIHPNLGSTLRVVNLGEHPTGRIITGLRDAAGRVWLAALVEESDL